MSAVFWPVKVTSGVVAAFAIAAVPLSFVGPGWLRLAAIGPFLLAGPGAALALLLWTSKPSGTRQPARWLAFGLTLAIGSSLAISVLVATVMIYARLWYPSIAICLVSAMTLGLIAVTVRRLRWPGPPLRWGLTARESLVRAKRKFARHPVPGPPSKGP
jgi:hypothetical protein